MITCDGFVVFIELVNFCSRVVLWIVENVICAKVAVVVNLVICASVAVVVELVISASVAVGVKLFTRGRHFPAIRM